MWSIHFISSKTRFLQEKLNLKLNAVSLPTQNDIFDPINTFAFMKVISLLREMGGLLLLLMNSLFKITALKLLPVLLTKNLYNYSTTQHNGSKKKKSGKRKKMNFWQEITADLVDWDLDEELEVGIVGPGSGALRLLAPAAGDEIDALPISRERERKGVRVWIEGLGLGLFGGD